MEVRTELNIEIKNEEEKHQQIEYELNNIEADQTTHFTFLIDEGDGTKGIFKEFIKACENTIQSLST